jgi:16S rRNA (uracil1498-N3)-methyltransferase
VHRFFAPSLDPGDETVALPRDEAEHLARVLRLGVGDSVAIFDGRGREYLARVSTVARGATGEVRVQILSRVEPPAEPAVTLTLVQSVLKGDKMDDVVRDAVMMGVAAVQPMVTTRAEITVAALMRGKVDRWRRVAIASVKQSRRAVLPDIRLPLTFENVLAEPAGSLRLMFVEPAAGEAESVDSLRNAPAPADAAVFIGPEGGWTEQEVGAARAAGVRLVTLGRRTLRADAVAIAAVSVLQFLWGDL